MINNTLTVSLGNANRAEWAYRSTTTISIVKRRA